MEGEIAAACHWQSNGLDRRVDIVQAVVGQVLVKQRPFEYIGAREESREVVDDL